MKTITKSQVLRRVKELKCTLSDDGDIIWLDAPKGMVFAGTGVHYLSWSIGRRQWEEAVLWRDIYNELTYGTEKCHIDNCDVCEE